MSLLKTDPTLSIDDCRIYRNYTTLSVDDIEIIWLPRCQYNSYKLGLSVSILVYIYMLSQYSQSSTIMLKQLVIKFAPTYATFGQNQLSYKIYPGTGYVLSVTPLYIFICVCVCVCLYIHTKIYIWLPWWLSGKESTCQGGDASSIPESLR